MKKVSKLTGIIKAYGDNVNTDVIHNPSKFTISREKLTVDLGLAGPPENRRVIIIAGENFGIGSSRYSTVLALKNSGVVAVGAKSLSRIFKRNLACAGIFAFEFVPGSGGEIAKISGARTAEIEFDANVAASHCAAIIRECGKKTGAVCVMDRYLFEIAGSGGMVKYLEESEER